jgi:hypothetical protein
MKTRIVIALLTAGTLLIAFSTPFAADKEQTQTKEQAQVQEQEQDKMIYGWQLMTVEERAQHRAKMQSLNTEKERQAYREEHHKLMQARAREQGVTIPDEPRSGGGSGFGPGPGAQSGSGSGGSGAGKGK